MSIGRVEMFDGASVHRLMKVCFLSTLVAMLGCRTASVDSAEPTIDIRPEDEPSPEDSQTDVDEVRDIDEDGFAEDVDCDDWNPNIFPGAVEELNNEDDDCDGYVDADGVHLGDLNFEAVAIYQGQPYMFSQACTGSLERISGQVSLLVRCEIDQQQERANQLLGGTLTISATENFVFDDVGSGTAVFVSTGGETEWDANGSTQWSWSTWAEDKSERVDVQVQLDALHLDIWMTGQWVRE